jgi:hypothetical protein
MKAAINNHILNTYMAFLETLSPGAKLDIISKLTQSLKSEVKSMENLFESSFGAWAGNESAEEIVKGTRDGRTFNRQTPNQVFQNINPIPFENEKLLNYL